MNETLDEFKDVLFLANPICRKLLTLRSVMVMLFPTEDCGVKRVGVVVVVVVVGNDRCLVEFDNLPPSPIRTAELPLPTFMPLGTVPLPVPILMPPPLMVLSSGLPSTNNGDTTNERIHAILMARNLFFEATIVFLTKQQSADTDSIVHCCFVLS